MEKDIKSALKDIVGSDYVTDEDFNLIAYARDVSPMRPRKADLIVLPQSTEQVSQVVKLANQTGTPVIVRGGGTMVMGNSLPRQGGIVLDLVGMDKILKIDEDTMVVTAQAGCPVYRVIGKLQRKGFDLPLRPEFGPGATMAGWVSATGAGLNMARYGNAASWLCGLEVVLPTGEIVQTGSAAYANCGPFTMGSSGPSLSHLFYKSWSLLGVITQVSIYMISLPETHEHAAYGFDDATSWARAGLRIQQKDAGTDVDLEDSDFFTDFVGMDCSYPFVLCVINEGYREEVKRKMEVVAQICEEHGGHTMSPMLTKAVWAEAAVLGALCVPFGRLSSPGYYHSYAALPRVYQACKGIMNKYNLRSGWVAWGAFPSTVSSFPMVAYNEENQWEDMLKAQTEIMTACRNIPDTIPALLKPSYYEFLLKIKKALDPNDIMNRGAFNRYFRQATEGGVE